MGEDEGQGAVRLLVQAGAITLGKENKHTPLTPPGRF